MEVNNILDPTTESVWLVKMGIYKLFIYAAL